MNNTAKKLEIDWIECEVKLKDLIPYERNPRRIKKEMFEKLVSSIQETGYHSRIKINTDNTIIGGHARKKAFKQLGFTDSDLIKVLKPHKHLSHEEFQRVNIQDNLYFGEFDMDMVANDHDQEQLEEWGMPEEWFEIDEDEVEAEVAPTVEPEEELIIPKEAITQPGDIWLLGKHRLVCGDSSQPEVLDKLMQNSLADMCFLDPPYGIKIDKWDTPIDINSTVFIVNKLLKDNAFFAWTMQMPPLFDWLKALENTDFEFKDHIVWVKRIATAIMLDITRSHETLMIYKKGKPEYCKTKGLYSDVKVPGVLYEITTLDTVGRHINELNAAIKVGGKKRRTNGSEKGNESYKAFNSRAERAPEEVNFTNVWSFLPEQRTTLNKSQEENIDHPTVKPILLMNRIIELCAKENDIVLDLFLGSGSTLIACERTKRICYGVELSPHYCDIIISRWERLTGEKAVLEIKLNEALSG